MLAQIPQDGKFQRRQRQFLAKQGTFVVGLRDGQPAEVVLLRGFGGGIRLVVADVTPQLCFDPRHQFQRVERLGDVVVGAQGQAHDLVHVLHLGGQHDDGEQVLFADLLAQRKAVHVRQHHVQNRQIQRTAGHAVQRVMGIVAFMYLIPLVFQADLHQVRNGGLVVYDQNLCHNRQVPSCDI